MRPPAAYDPRWPRCGLCGVRHPHDNPHLPIDDHEVRLAGEVVFLGFREQCEDRAATMRGATVRKRVAEYSLNYSAPDAVGP